MLCDHIEEVYNTYSDCIDFFINQVIFSMRISVCTCAVCDHIDFNMVMIIISVYIQNMQYLTCTDIYKRMISDTAVSKAMFVFGGHMTYHDWYIHTCQQMSMQ